MITKNPWDQRKMFILNEIFFLVVLFRFYLQSCTHVIAERTHIWFDGFSLLAYYWRLLYMRWWPLNDNLMWKAKQQCHGFTISISRMVFCRLFDFYYYYTNFLLFSIFFVMLIELPATRIIISQITIDREAIHSVKRVYESQKIVKKCDFEVLFSLAFPPYTQPITINTSRYLSKKDKITYTSRHTLTPWIAITIALLWITIKKNKKKRRANERKHRFGGGEMEKSA